MAVHNVIKVEIKQTNMNFEFLLSSFQSGFQ